eukprot:5057276-Pyramimonas_sp.AAC.1
MSPAKCQCLGGPIWTRAGNAASLSLRARPHGFARNATWVHTGCPHFSSYLQLHHTMVANALSSTRPTFQLPRAAND